MTSPKDRDLLSQKAARQLLERAGQIDLETTSVDTLRAAAREAGISEAAFEVALAEMRGGPNHPVAAAPVRSKRRIIIAAAGVALAAGIAFVIAAITLIPTRAELGDHRIEVRCLSMKSAQEIAQRTVVTPETPDNEVRIWGSRTLRVRATNEEATRLRAVLDAAARAQTSCDNTPSGR